MLESSSKIVPINIEDEMKSAYIDYAMSVIISRALPDVRDGLKPVHRRVLYGMSDLGLMFNKPFKKSARIVGEVLGKYHPHGDASVYDTMVRMAQTWSLRYPLVDGQGNFGSIDGDSPAAMRYTEARLKRISDELLSDLNKDTIDFQPNFDESLKEPTVLPCKIPHLLVNGTSGIAVGMATNMPPHNLSEVVDGIIAYLDNNEITVEELIQYIPAPDFPTGGIIYGYQGVKKAMLTGRGRVVVRGVAEIETTKTGRERIIVTEIPYLVNKASLIEKTAHLVQEKRIEGISDIRDESDRNGMRIVYELKRDAVPMVVLNQLYKYTALQSSFGVNNVALVKGRPQILNLRDLIYHFVEHRHEVIYRRTQFELKEAKARQHILEGLLIALDNLDEVIALIRASKDGETAKNSLIETFELSELQAKAILDIRLQRLTAMERDKIIAEHKEISALIEKLEAILADKGLRVNIIKEELNDMKDRYGDARRTEIEHFADDLTDEDMIPEEEMVITISHEGYMRRTSLDEYRTQNRGGVGSRGTSKKDDDFTEHLFVASTHDYLLFFTNSGKVFWLKGYNIPEGSKTAKGRAMQNLLQMESGDSIRAVINVKRLQDPDYNQNHYLVMCTEKGVIKKTRLEAFSRPRQNGIHAITINEDDQLLDVKLTNGDNNIILAVRSGRAIHFHEDQVRSMGRTATGVRGVTLSDETDRVVGMVCVARDDASLLVVSENGYGKRSSIEDYRITNRGGKGVITLQVTDKTGLLVSIKEAVDTDDLILITKIGLVIRMSMSDMRVMGRATQGVRLIKLHEDDSIASVAKVDTTTLLKEDENAEDQAAEGAENTPQSNTEENTEKGDEKNDDESEG
ncbi:DNA gyrase subunit A [marine bacterium AO1-C]|nr:DNA gyrase subunit A [marine bacterium AO1-C]